jgi:replicative DNA helicase
MLLPSNKEIEQAVLAAVILEEEGRMVGISKITNQDVFYYQEHQIIFQTIKDIFNGGNKVDLITIVSQLMKISKLDFVGGAVYITDLTNKVNSSENIESHIALLKEYWIRRKHIDLGQMLIKESLDDSKDAIDTLTEFQHKSSSITEELSSTKILTGKALLRKSLESIAKAKHQFDSGEVSGLSMGINSLDRFTGGFQKSDLIIIAARPGMGKTAIVLQMLKHPAVVLNKPIAMFSLEMPGIQLMNRLISSETDVFFSKMTRGEITDEEHRRIMSHTAALSTDNILVEDGGGLDISQLKAKATMLKMQYDIQMVIVDYLQLMSAVQKKGSNREQEISTITRNLKLLAKELQIPVIALSQLSRAVESRPDKTPQLSDLRESGAIEQDADVVIFPYRPKYYKEDVVEIDGVDYDSEFIMQLIFAKHRNGACGIININCDVRTNKFWDFNAPRSEISYANYYEPVKETSEEQDFFSSNQEPAF